MAIDLALTANGRPDVTLRDGEVLTLWITLANNDGDPVTLGGPGQPWWERVEVVDQGGDRVFWPFEPLTRYPAENEIALDAGGAAELELGLGPEDVSGIPRGVYSIAAAISISRSDRVESSRVRVEVAGEPIEEETSDHLASLAVFLTKRRRHVDARAVIERLAGMPGASLRSLLLLGELQERQGDPAGAIRTYEQAERQFWVEHADSYEGPEVIASRIVKLRHTLAGANIEAPSPAPESQRETP